MNSEALEKRALDSEIHYLKIISEQNQQKNLRAWLSFMKEAFSDYADFTGEFLFKDHQIFSLHGGLGEMLSDPSINDDAKIFVSGAEGIEISQELKATVINKNRESLNVGFRIAR